MSIRGRNCDVVWVDDIKREQMPNLMHALDQITQEQAERLQAQYMEEEHKQDIYKMTADEHRKLLKVDYSTLERRAVTVTHGEYVNKVLYRTYVKNKNALHLHMYGSPNRVGEMYMPISLASRVQKDHARRFGEYEWLARVLKLNKSEKIKC